MKRVFVIALAFLFSMPAVCQLADSRDRVTVLHDANDSLQIEFVTDGMTFGEVTLDGMPFATVAIEGMLPSEEVGRPALPVFSQLIEVPLCQGFEVKIIDAVFDTLSAPLLPLVPTQPLRRKSDTSKHPLVMDNEVYAADMFYGLATAMVEPIGIARDRNLARLQISPISYNPVSRQLIVCRKAIVTVVYRDADVSATKNLFERYYTPAFATVAGVLNNLYPKAVNSSAPVRYLIVAHSMFRGQLNSFVQWKRRKGFIVDVVYTDSAAVGTTTTSIAAYIKSQYTNATTLKPAPTYLLLVGDVEQIPAFAGTTDNDHVTDLYYTTWTDGDIVPDCYHGRFSAQNIAQLTPQIEKTLMYEQYTFADPTFLDRAVMVAGVDAGTSGDNAYNYGDPSMDYAITNYINGSRGFQQVRYYKNNTAIVPSVTHLTMGDCRTVDAAEVRRNYNEGAGLINYTAHGSPTCWGTPYFGTDNVPEMTNYQKFGLMIGNCCQSNTFTLGACLGEALLRRGDYCGAVGYIGASNSTYWTYDFYWSVGPRTSVGPTMSMAYNASQLGAYDRLCHTHNEAYSNWAITQGGLMMAGNMAVASKVGNSANYYWEIYHLMGDPSVMPYLTQAQTIDISVQPIIATGTTSLQVNVVPYAYVALTDSATHSLKASAFANSTGIATLALPTNLTTGVYELTASAQQYRTSFRSLQVVSPTLWEAYVFASDMDAATEPNAGDTLSFAVSIKNLGMVMANSVTVRFTSDCSWMTFLCDSAVVPIVMPGGISTVNVTAVLSQQVPDGTLATITATSLWGGNHTSAVRFPVYVNAPLLHVSYSPTSLSVLPGESGMVQATITNQGHAALPASQLRLLSPTSWLSVTPLDTAGFTLASGSSITLQYALQADSQLPQGIVVPLRVQLDGFYSTINDTLRVVSSAAATETFEGGSFHLSGWSQGSIPWVFTSSVADGGLWSLRSNSGLTHNQTSEISFSYTFTQSDSIRFRYRVSSERNYDKFYFYIDNHEELNASGSVSWTSAAFPVQAGTHTFRFSYSKDYSVSDSLDCAWIDNVILPPVASVVAFVADTACSGSVDVPSLNTHVVTDAAGTRIVESLLLPLHHIDTMQTVCDSLLWNGEVYTESDILTHFEVNDEGCDSITLNLVVNHSVHDTTVVEATGNCYQWGEMTCSTSGEYEQYHSTVAGCDSVVVLLLTLVPDEEGISTTAIDTISVYPSPTSGMVYFNSMVGVAEVYDINGHLLASKRNTDSFDLSQLPAGVYLIRLTTLSGSATCRVMKL